jgi:hypothetical protein
VKYGVDINPMAVEMAKLSLWLITLHRDRPFTFLDHAQIETKLRLHAEAEAATATPTRNNAPPRRTTSNSSCNATPTRRWHPTPEG